MGYGYHCQKEASKRWRKKNPEKVKSYNKKYGNQDLVKEWKIKEKLEKEKEKEYYEKLENCEADPWCEFEPLGDHSNDPEFELLNTLNKATKVMEQLYEYGYGNQEILD